MVHRIFLILAILAGLGVIALSHFKVRPHIQGIIDERNKQTTRAETAEKNLRDTTRDLNNTKQTLDRTQRDLRDTRSTLDQTKSQLASEQKRANDLDKNLKATQADLRSAQQELSAWKNLGIPVEKVKETLVALDKAKAEIEVLRQENQIVVAENKKLQKIIDDVINPKGDIDIPMPEGILGRVMVVDPKWNFVILDIGSKDKVIVNSVGLVSRNGRLIAKVKVKSVQEDRCVANVKPGFSLDEIMEGDLVISPGPPATALGLPTASK